MRRLRPTGRAAALLVAGLVLALPGCDPTASREPDAASPDTPERDAPADPGAISRALEDPDPYARARALGTLIPTLGPESLAEAKQILQEFRLGLGAVEFELLLRFWASQEPREAARWTFKDGPPLYKVNAVRTAVETWAEVEPTKAVAAVGEARKWSDDILRITQMALVRGWFSHGDREGLVSYIEGLGSGEDRQRAVYSYALSLAGADGSEAVIRWAESIPDDDNRYKLEVFRQVMSALAWGDPPAATRFCELHCEGPWAKGLRSVLIRTRLNRGEFGGDIVEWVAQAPDETEEQIENKAHALWVAYALWASREPEVAITWLQERLVLPESEREDWVPRLYGEYSRLIAADSPERAMEWAERISKESERHHTMIRIAKYWLTVDEEAAEAWIAQSPLDERELAAVRKDSPHFLPRVPREQGGAAWPKAQEVFDLDSEPAPESGV